MNEKQIRRLEELREKNKAKKSKDGVAIIISTVIFFIIFILSYTYYTLTPVDKNDSSLIPVEVKEGASSSSVASVLEEKGLIRNSLSFILYSRIVKSTEFYVGTYDLSKQMSIAEILDQLNETSKKSGKMLSIIEGDNIEKIATKIEDNTDISADEFIEKVNDKQFIETLKKEFPDVITEELDDEDIKYKLEGYLYPASYEIDHTNIADPEILIKEMVRQTQINVLPKYNSNSKIWNIQGKNVNITLHQYLTLASILEKESTRFEDANSSIAQVFLNRLEEGMQLGTDPALIYAFNKVELTFDDLKREHPYNMHINLGLPPGPIATISQTTYDALNNAKQHDYLYFLTDPDGNAYFAKTYAEHEALARKHVPGYVSTN